MAGFACQLEKFIREDVTHSEGRQSRNNTVWAKKRNIFLPVCQHVYTLVLFSLK